MAVYLDTSIVGSYYCPEALSDPVAKAIHTLKHQTISTLVELEFLSLVGLKVQMNELDAGAAGRIIELFRSHLAAGLYERVDVGAAEHAAAATWLAGLATPLRTLDALHLAAAHVNRLEIWTTDKSLARAAELLNVKHRLITLHREV